MEVEYVSIHHEELDTYILVPKEWPKRANSLLLTLAELIIAQYNQVSPVVKISNISTRLICRMNDMRFYYIFNKVSEEETIGAFIYNIIVPAPNEDINIEIVSGHDIDRILWSNYGTSVTPITKQLRQQEEMCDVCGGVIGEKSR